MHLVREPRESIIEDLGELGVRVNEILLYGPTYSQLKGMRDGLRLLRDALRDMPIPHGGAYFTSLVSFSRSVREEMK
jgi:hypothetical protein